MERLRLDGSQHPKVIECPPMVKTPQDVYRVEVRATFHPDADLCQVAVEVTHESTRELIYWSLGPLVTGEGSAVAEIERQAARAATWVSDLWAPF